MSRWPLEPPANSREAKLLIRALVYARENRRWIIAECEAALDNLPHGDDNMAEISRQLGKAYAAEGRFDDAIRVVSEHASVKGASARARTLAHCFIALVCHYTGNAERAQQELDAARRIVEAAGDDRLQTSYFSAWVEIADGYPTRPFWENE